MATGAERPVRYGGAYSLSFFRVFFYWPRVVSFPPPTHHHGYYRRPCLTIPLLFRSHPPHWMFYSFSPSFRLLCCICAVRSDVETIERERRMPSGHVTQGEAGGKKMAKRKKKKEEEEEKKRKTLGLSGVCHCARQLVRLKYVKRKKNTNRYTPDGARHASRPTYTVQQQQLPLLLLLLKEMRRRQMRW